MCTLIKLLISVVCISDVKFLLVSKVCTKNAYVFNIVR
jgi:hypothetical protein